MDFMLSIGKTRLRENQRAKSSLKNEELLPTSLLSLITDEDIVEIVIPDKNKVVRCQNALLSSLI
jgi:hypothetical protein